ncbi:MAG: ATP-dependent zinc protease [Legionellaceae bacterium]|nr:ATP-dependent zinc protease [Legionellaceae bacterium]
MRCIALALLLVYGNGMAESSEKQIYGYVEKVWLKDIDHSVSAKLDTGARSASLSAIDIREIEENDQIWLLFKVPGKNGSVELKRPYVGTVKIKQRSEEKIKGHAAHAHRPVVLMTMRIGDKERSIKVNLTNRKRFIYPLLLGREAIKEFNGMVDPSLTYTVKIKTGNP